MPRNFLEKKDVSIVAYGETKITRRSGKTAYELAAEVAEELFKKTKLKPSDINGLATGVPLSECGNPFWSNYLADYLGISPSWIQTTDMGGASAIGSVARAAMAIQSGLCDTVMIVMADAVSTVNKSNHSGYRDEFWTPTGVQGPPGAFGFLMNRYAHQYELDYTGLAKLAVAQRNGAVLNNNAYPPFRKKITVEDYIASRQVSSPLRLYDSVMFCDGANGIIMMSTAKARRLGFKNRVYPISYSEITNYKGAEQAPDITESGFLVSGPDAFKKAGLKPRDIDMFHPYDDFLIAVMLQLEHLGFAPRGGGSQFLRDTDISPKGQLPINTGGGQISSGQPGLASGMLNTVEAVRQLFGEAGRRQVPNPKNAVVTGIGVIPYGRNWGASNVLILSK